MKRFICFALALSLLIALPSPFVSAAEAGVVTEDRALSDVGQPGGDAAASAAGETKGARDTLSVVSVQNIPAPTASNNTESLSFDRLRGAMNTHNANVLSLQTALLDLGSVTSDDLWDAIISLDQLSGTIDGALQMAQEGAAAGGELAPVYQALAASLSIQKISTQSQISSLKSQRENMGDSVESSKNTLNNSINLLVKGAEQLFVGIVTMEAAIDDVKVGIAALDRAVAITEKRQELGMASAFDTESMRHQRNAAASQLESLKFQLKTNKLTLEGMCGMELRGSVRLEPPSLPTQDELNGVSYDRSYAQASGRNVDVMNAELAYNTKSSSPNKRALQAAVDSFASKFKIICLTVPEQSRLVSAAQETVEFQQRTLAIAEKKYALGLVSSEDYLAAQGELQGAESDLYTAGLNLLTAYRNYIWAKDFGVA